MKTLTTTTLTLTTMTALLASTGLAACGDAATPQRPTFIDGGRVYTVPAEGLDVHGLMREIEEHADDDAALRQLAVWLEHVRHAGPQGAEDLAAPVPVLEAGWITLEEGEYAKELLFVGNDCGDGFDFDPEQPGEPEPPAMATNPLIFDSSPAGFTKSATFVGEATPLPNHEVLCSSEGLLYACDDKINEIPGFFAPEFIGGPFDATLFQTSQSAGLLDSSDEYVELQGFSNTCEGPECEAFVVALDGLVGGGLLDTLDCTTYSGWRQVLVEGE